MQELGKFKWNTRNYEVSIWTLQDSFIATLKGADPVWDPTDPTVTWPMSRQKGRIENARMTLNMDGTQTFSFDVPMYIREKGVKTENPSWYSKTTGNIYVDPDSDKRENPSWVIVQDGNILVSMRKIKVIFDKHETNYPLLPNDKERAWDVFSHYIPEDYQGNVDLWNRRIISAGQMRTAGYVDFEGDYTTLYAQSKMIHNMMMIYTPITAAGVILSDSDVYSYLLELGDSPEDVLANDAEGQSLILECFSMSDYRYKRDALARANRFIQDLQEMQSKWDVIRYHNRWFGQPEKDSSFTFAQSIHDEEALLRTQNTFEFLITKVTESHTADNMLCHIECEGLPFHEIGKVGFKRSLSSTVFQDEYNEWKEKEYEATATQTASEVKAANEPIANLQYWMSKAEIPSYDDTVAANKAINPAQWYYKIRMARTSIDDLNIPPDTHIYEDAFVTDWDDNGNPLRYTVAREKTRPVDIDESNIYNITQDLAEKFGVFCKYEYDYDDNYNIIGRNIVFYNNFLSESNEVTTLLYPNTAEEITREMDSVDITSKMFIRSVDDETTYSGKVTIMDSKANYSLEDYLLNFDYLHAIGTITDDQYAIIPKFEAGMRKINSNLNPLGDTIGYLTDLKVDLEAKEQVLISSIELDKERITESTALMAQLEADGKMDSEGYIHITWQNPDTLYLLKNADNSEYDTYDVKLNQGGKVGIDPESLHLYKTYRYGSSAKEAEYAVCATAPVRCYATVAESEYFSYDTFERMQFGLKPEDSPVAWSTTKPATETGSEATQGKYVWTRKGLDQANGSQTYTYTIQYIKKTDDEPVNEYITTARFIFYKENVTPAEIPTAENLDLYHADNADVWTTYMPTQEGNDKISYISEFRTSSSNRQYGLSDTNKLLDVEANNALITQQTTAAAERLGDELTGTKHYDKYGNLDCVQGLLRHSKYGNYYYYCIVPDGSTSLIDFQDQQFQLVHGGSETASWSNSRPTPNDTCYLWILNEYRYWNGYNAKLYAVQYYENGIQKTPVGSSYNNFVKSITPIFYLKTKDTITDAPAKPEKHASSKGENVWTTVLPDKPADKTEGTDYRFYTCSYITYFGKEAEYTAVSTLDSSSMTAGKSTTSDVPKYIYATYRYKPELYYEKIKDTWIRKLNKDETDLEKTRNKLKLVKSRITTYQEDYDARLASKKALIAKFERRMGPALRESYWQPENEYQNYGTPYHDTLSAALAGDLIYYSQNGEQRAIFSLNKTDTYASFGFDGYLFEDEENLLYDYGITQDKMAYPCIDLRKVKSPANTNKTFIEYCKGKTKDHQISFFFNPNTSTIPAGGVASDIRYMQAFTIGSEAHLGLLWSSNEIIPVLYLTGAENLSDDQIVNMRKTGHLGVLETHEDPSTHSLTLGCDVIFEVPDDPNYPDDIAWLTFENTEAQGLVMPRIKVDSLYLKKNSDDITLVYTPTALSKDNITLEQYEDYYINAKTFYEQDTYNINGVPRYKGYSDVAELVFSEDESDIDRYKNYKGCYVITIKPETLFEMGLPQTRNQTSGKLELDLKKLKFEFYYKLSNAATEIYLDAKKILKENAYPKVSYTVKSIPLHTEFSRTLYKQLGQIIMVNDTDLKFQNVFGYISQVELDLDSPDADNIEVKNYKTKFEDLFSKIVAETEAMQKNAYNIGLAGALGTGGTINSPLGLASFHDTLHNNADVLIDFLEEYFDGPNVVRTQIQKMFNEAGQIMSSAYTSLNHVVGLSMDNANTLAGFRENVAAALTPTVYTGPIMPANFKAGDIWINSEGDKDYRGVAISGSASGGSFIQTYNGKLSEIDGPSFGMNAATGEIDIINKTNINLSSGHSILIMANDTVEIVGNKSVNIGGTAINIATARTFDTVNGQKVSTMFGGIHLVATDYDRSTNVVPGTANGAQYEAVEYNMTLNSTSKVDITGEGIEMATKNGIVIKAGAGIDIKSAAQETDEDGNVVDYLSAIRLDGQTGIYLGSTAPIKFYSGPAVNIFYGPHRGAQFKRNDYWYRVNNYIADEENGGNFDNLDEAGNQIPTVNNKYYLLDNKPVDYGVWYKAVQDWSEVYGAEGYEASLAAKRDTNGWDTLENLGEGLPQVAGANVEITSKAIYLGVQSNLNNATSISLDEEEIILAAGKDLATVKSQKDDEGKKLLITDIGSAAISGVEIMPDYIGMATGESNDRSILSLKPGFVQLGTMTLEDPDHPELPESYKGSYIWMDKGEMYFGSLGHFTLNTNNIKIQTKEIGDVADGNKPGTNMANPTKMGFCLGKNLQADPNSAEEIKPMPKLGFWVDTDDEAHLVVDGDITANVLYANGALNGLNHGPVFKVDGNVLGIFNLTNDHPSIDSADLGANGIFYWYNNTLYIKGNLVVSDIQIEGTPWSVYWAQIGVDDLGQVQTDLTQMATQMAQIITAAEQSVSDVQSMAGQNFGILQSFYNNISANLTPHYFEDDTYNNYRRSTKTESNGTVTYTPAPYFKQGDMWKHREYDDATQTYYTNEYMATCNWDDLYWKQKTDDSTAYDDRIGAHKDDANKKADSEAALTSLNGWSRTSNGRLAGITGAGMKVDAAAGLFEIWSGSVMNLLCAGTINIAGQDVSITGEHTLALAGPDISLTSAYTKAKLDTAIAAGKPFIGGIRMTATVTGYTGDDVDLNGTSYINMNGQGIEIAAKGGIVIKSGRGIDISFSTGENAGTSAIRINETEGVWIGSGKAVNLSSNSSAVTGSLFNMTPERILMGVTGLTDNDNSHTTAIDITKQQIVIAASGDLKAIRDNGSGQLVSHDASGNPSLAINVSGVLIRKDYIGMAVNETVNNMQFFSLMSLAPREVLIGAGKISGSDKHVGSYVKMTTQIINDDIIAHLDIGSTGKFTVQTATYWVDNAATGNNPMFRLRQIVNGTNKDLLTFSQGQGLTIYGDITATRFMSSSLYDSGTKLAAFIVDSGSMGFYRFSNINDYPNNIANAKPLMWFKNGDMYISGRLQVGEVYVGDTLWDEYFSSQHAGWMGEVHETLQDMWDSAGEILAAASSSVGEAAAAALDGEGFLAGFREDLADKLTPVTFVDTTVDGAAKRGDGTNVIGKFKIGDLWKHTEVDSVTGTSVQHTYMATANWSDIYFKPGDHTGDESAAIAGAGSLKGWSRVSDGRLAAITGAGATWDVDSGYYEIKAKNRISILTNGLLELAGQDLSITGEKTLKFAGPSISIISNYTDQTSGGAGGLGESAPIRGIRIITRYTDTTNSANNGLSTILLSEGITMESRFGIDVASATGIKVRTSATDNDDPRASVIELSPSEGVRIAADKGIYISSTKMVNKNVESLLNGGIISITHSRILMGVTETRKNNTSATTDGSVVDITKEYILLAYGKNISLDGATSILDADVDISGVEIKKDLIAMAVSKNVTISGTTYHYRSLLEMSANKFRYGLDGRINNDVYDEGSYIEMEIKRKGSKEIAYFTVGSTGEFRVLCPNLVLDTTTRTANNSNPMFYVANNANWATATKGIRFSTGGGVEIKAHKISISTGDLDDQFDATNKKSIKWYYASSEVDGSGNPKAPSVTDGQALGSGWSQQLKKVAVGSNKKYIWSVMQHTTKNNTITYDDPIHEGDLEDFSEFNTRMYIRTSTSTKPTFDSTTVSSWSESVPKPTYSTVTSGGHNKTTVTNKYVWSAVLTEKINGTKVYGTVHEEESLEVAANAIAEAQNIESGYCSVPHVDSSGILIDGGLVQIKASSTLEMLANSQILFGVANSNSFISIGDGGITMSTGKLLNISSNKFGIYSTGLEKTDIHVAGDSNTKYIMWAGSASPEDTLSGETYTTGNVTYNKVSSRGAKFRVTSNGYVFLDKLMLWDEQHKVYIPIDFSDFNKAISLSLTVDGNSVRANATYWGKIPRSTSSAVTFTLDSVTRSQSWAAGFCDITVKCHITTANGTIYSNELTGKGVNVYDIEAAGWNAAAGSISYTPGAKVIWVPARGGYGSGAYTKTEYDISATYDAGYDDGVASVTIPTLKVSQSLSKTDKYAHLIAIASNGAEKTWDCYCGLIWEGGYDAGYDEGFAAGLAACSMSASRTGNTVQAKLTKNGSVVETKTFVAALTNDTHAVSSSGTLTGSGSTISWS